jgi:hypothetical protein
MSYMKRTLSMAGMLTAGVVAAFGIYLVCVVAMFLAGGWVYSIALGAQLAPVVTIAIGIYCWTRRRDSTLWPLMAAMTATQLVLAALGFLDNSSAATLLFR